MARLDRDFFLQDTLTAAQQLLGRYLVRVDGNEIMVCRITETEAYVGAVDKACHAYGGKRTPRTQTLYAGPGTVYVYLIYGMYHCLNFVTGPEGTASAVLVRGCTPVWNVDAVSRRRFGVPADRMSAYQRKNFMNGPGKLCKGLSIDSSLNAAPIGSPQLYLTDELPELSLPKRPDVLPFCTGKRIGIDYAEEAADFPWRFWIEDGIGGISGC